MKSFPRELWGLLSQMYFFCAFFLPVVILAIFAYYQISSSRRRQSSIGYVGSAVLFCYSVIMVFEERIRDFISSHLADATISIYRPPPPLHFEYLLFFNILTIILLLLTLITNSKCKEMVKHHSFTT